MIRGERRIASPREHDGTPMARSLIEHDLKATIRTNGKLPHTTVRIAYSLEYGLDEMEMHEDAVTRGDRIILVDDLIATGGTAEGAVKLLRNAGAQVLAACFIIDLP